MGEWLAANAATIIICVALAVLAALAVRQIIKGRKKGGCAGCSGCSGACPQRSCQEEAKAKRHSKP